MKLPRSIQDLIDEFSKLPTVGPKTAERYVFYLLKQNAADIQKFSTTILNLKNGIAVCKKCFAATETDPCAICSDKKRNESLLCIVANTRDLLSIEATKEFNGLYHVLGGTLNAIEGIKPENLTVNNLIEKIKDGKIKEIILALNFNLAGETTAMYLAKILMPYNIKITRLAKGLPSGSDLEYADEMTLASALKHRTKQ
ncbi:MAG: recombination mediator RecR [bacterium]